MYNYLTINVMEARETKRRRKQVAPAVKNRNLDMKDSCSTATKLPRRHQQDESLADRNRLLFLFEMKDMIVSHLCRSNLFDNGNIIDLYNRLLLTIVSETSSN